MKDGDINPIERHPSRQRLQPDYIRDRHTRKISSFPLNLILPAIILGVVVSSVSSIYSNFKNELPQIKKDIKKLTEPNSGVKKRSEANFNKALIEKKRLLFLGNSLTSQHNVPAQVCNILNASNSLKQIKKTSAYMCEQKTKGGYWLAHHYKELKTYNKRKKHYEPIKKYKKNWSWIILQEQSAAPGVDEKHENYKFYRKALKNLSKLFEGKSKNLALYMTWGHKDGYQRKKFRKRYPTFERMNELLEIGYLRELTTLAKDGIYLTPLPAGKAFAKIKNDFGEKEFYKLYSDDHHTSLDGSQLAALVISAGIIREEKDISEEDWLKINWKPRNIKREKVLQYKKIAWEVTGG